MSATRLLAMVLSLGTLSAPLWALAQAPAGEPKIAQTPTPAEQPAKPKAPLKLRLDDATSAAPRVTFEPRQGESKDKPGDGLPSLGGDRSRAFDESIRRSTTNPFPPDTQPGR